MTKPLLTLLGTGTCQLEADRVATSALIELPKLRVLFDLGRGVCQRIAQLELCSDDIEHIVFSHYHPDHISDLIPFLQNACWHKTRARRKDLHLYGPIGLEVQVMRLIGAFGARDILPQKFKLRFHEQKPGGFSIQGHAFSRADLPPADNLGLKWNFRGRCYALTGDAYFHPNLIEFAKGCDVLVIDSGHPSDPELVELAVRANPGHIVCSHVYRALNLAELLKRARQRGFKGKLSLGRDLQRIPLS